MKIFLFYLLIIQLTASAQPKIKKVRVDGSGIPLVMLAGALANMNALNVPVKDLSQKFKVIRMEHFNIQYAAEGKLLPKNYSVRTESEAIKYTLDSLGIKEPVVLVGNSFGGLIALAFAINHPKRVRSLVLLEPPFFGLLLAKNESPEGLQRILDVTKEYTPQAEITEEMVERFRCLQLNCDTINIRQLPQWKSWVDRKNIHRGGSTASEYKANFKKLNRFRKPVLLISGTQSTLIYKRITELLKEELPHSKRIFIESGHSITATAPKEVVNAIIEFVK